MEVILKKDIIIRFTSLNNDTIASSNDIVLKLDTNLTDELKEEGMTREIVRNIQDARKQLGCEIDDHIKIDIDYKLSDNLTNYILNETLSTLDKLEEFDLKLNVESNDKVVIVKIKK